MDTESPCSNIPLQTRESAFRGLCSIRGRVRDRLAPGRSFQPKHLLKVCSLALCVCLTFGSSLWSQEVRYSRVAEPAEHDHWIVSVSGIPVIVIRSKAGFSDLESRTRHTAEHLQEAFSELWTTLENKQRPLAGFVVEDCAGNPCIGLIGTEIVLVTRVDAVAYERRDPHHHERHIDKRVVGEYWRALLQDTALLLNGQEPATLREFNETKILAHIYAETTRKKGRIPRKRAIGEVISSLDSAQRRGLQQLVLRIPRRFHTPVIISQLQPARSETKRSWAWIVFFTVVLLLLTLVAYAYASYARAKYKAFRTGALRVPFLGGLAELILWEPGETVVLLKHKKLVPMTDPTGGYRVISALHGQEYKGRITFKSQFLEWTSDPILTSDGLLVNLTIVIGWLIKNPNLYVSRISADYHVDESHYGDKRAHTEHPQAEKEYDKKLIEAAERWIKNLAGSALREHVCQLPVEKIISPYVQTYIQVESSDSKQPLLGFSGLLDEARVGLNRELEEYGISIERLKVRELKLPEKINEKLEAVRLAFLEPVQSQQLSDAKGKAIERLGEARAKALLDLAGAIGISNAAMVEIIKASGIAKIPAPMLSMFQSIVTEVHKENEEQQLGGRLGEIETGSEPEDSE